MKVEDFEEALTEGGIEYYISGRSIRLKECPECGKEKYNVIMDISGQDEKVFLGKCLSGSCGQGYSSASYLRKMGMEDDLITHFHGFDPMENFRKALSISTVKKKDFFEKKATKEIEYVENDISRFMKPEHWPDHPASIYAYKRGYDETVCGGDVLIDPDSCAVVFVCRDIEGKVLGFQRRYTVIVNDGPKTRTSKGFFSNKNILVFNRASDKVAICEGPFTALAAARFGFCGVATFGSAISQEQLDMIFDLGGDKVYVARENDEPGQKYYRYIYGYAMDKKMSVDILEPEVGDDLNDTWMEGKGYKILEGEEVNFLVPKFKF